ncbi:B-cell receptor-associated protein 31 isoform X2 [Diceros bicornis minor]|uniref:B-cell receptor-associated protein 31 isoform X2 n=1 Tax=Diceros bicornis minor TaxID=77932 RepID=UPI0026F249F7|nr:B-cell receptor-associated protein 31 isoform X2 [Diceros bicornis minor]
MSLQWTAVATFLYAEVFAVLLLCIPFISPKRWQKIFKSRLVELVVTYGNTFFVVLIVILVLLVIDAVREIWKYDDVTEKVNLQNNPGAMEHFHMKLFRAQRNLYIAGFSLLLSFLLRRLVTLISQQATLLASNEAFKKQAESASEAAKKYMEENDQLKKETAVGGVKLDGRDAEVKAGEENRSLKADLKKLKDELAINKQSGGRWSHGQEGGMRALLPACAGCHLARARCFLRALGTSVCSLPLPGPLHRLQFHALPAYHRDPGLYPLRMSLLPS